jgi:Flp pilus assembly pilin Flp
MGGLRKLLLRLVAEEHGGEVLEYALVCCLITVVCITAIASVGTKLHNLWKDLDAAYGGM